MPPPPPVCVGHQDAGGMDVPSPPPRRGSFAPRAEVLPSPSTDAGGARLRCGGPNAGSAEGAMGKSPSSRGRVGKNANAQCGHSRKPLRTTAPQPLQSLLPRPGPAPAEGNCTGCDGCTAARGPPGAGGFTACGAVSHAACCQPSELRGGACCHTPGGMNPPGASQPCAFATTTAVPSSRARRRAMHGLHWHCGR